MQKLQSYLVIALLMAALALFLPGCGKKANPVLAKVGGDEITSQDLNDIFDRSGSRFLSFEDEYNSRHTILDSLVIQQLLIQAAYKKRIDASEEVNRIVLASTDKFLLDILYQREITDKIKITDQEVQDFYDKLEYKLKASHILLPSQEMGRMVMDSLKGGASFEEMAVNHSVDPSARTNRGDLGYFIWGRMDPSFQEQVFKLNPGEMSEPFQTRYGWHIVKMMDRVPNDQRQGFEQMKAGIRASLENIKTSTLMEQFRNKLKEKYPVKVEIPTCEYLMQRRASLYPPQLLETLPKNDFDVNQLDRDEKEMVLGTWDGGQITLGQYLATIMTLQRQYARLPIPNFDQYDSLASFIFQVNAQAILAQESRRSGLENDSEFKRKIKKFKELTMADVMENDSILMAGSSDEGEMRTYYDGHQDEFKIPPKIHLYEMMLSDQTAAKQYAGKVSSLEKFKSLANDLTERPGKRGSGGDLGYVEERFFPELFKAAQNTPVGDVAGPISMGGGKYSIIYVADKMADEIRDFQMVKQTIKDTLEKGRKRKAFAEWVEQQKKEVNIRIYEDELRETIDKTKYAAADSARG
ncbi:MAG: peptidylprolyl isomerase [candidate division Zixibacteria bacterium]|nr:peptidylprolyl isomerase [candidate division Zixibacteria bacterium]